MCSCQAFHYNSLSLSLSLSLSPSLPPMQDGFREVVETLLKRQQRLLQEQERSRTHPDTSPSANESPTFWQNTAAFASVAVGAAVLLGLKQAFS